MVEYQGFQLSKYYRRDWIVPRAGFYASTRCANPIQSVWGEICGVLGKSNKSHSFKQVSTDFKDSHLTSTDKCNPLHKEGAYNGDSLKDKDYFEGQQKLQRAATLKPEHIFVMFLNMLCMLINNKQDQCGHSWYAIFSKKWLESDPEESQWNRKPDLVLLGEGLHQDDSSDSTVTWKSSHATCEIMISWESLDKPNHHHL